MGAVITVMNMKGGVGKTTVAAHLAGISARYLLGSKPRKVLVIDYDPQFNLSQAFLQPKTYFALERDRKTILSVLLDDDVNLNPYQLQVPGNHIPPKAADLVTRIYSFQGAHLDLLPSTLDLMYVALGQATGNTAPMEERFSKFIEECRTLYDLVYIDCHPAGSLFTKTSLRNSDHVIIPVAPQRYALRGIGLMMNFINSKKVGHTSPAPHILFNATPRVGISSEELQIRATPEFTAHCMKNTLKKFKAFSEPEAGMGFTWASRKPYSGEALSNLLNVANELMMRTGA
ncbi:ParA family protein [Bradyrhizobium stylosanthis]|uniref:Chromosome partitioning protein n=1 Tax=Bradyrhizobium stylosanthis TaxID=1803665 RepID=A0A560D2R8_9BRAD|nr:ParA family protein [Bradyrhizobium stylosanthis]TWA91353.1 chromosome partitioning protein [Bradyrhizobium stylosanthis]